MNSSTDMAAFVAAFPYTWPGGYPTYAVMADLEGLCSQCCKTEAKLLASDEPEWQVIGVAVNYEDEALYCCHCNAQIPSAYGDDGLPEQKTE